MGDNPRVVRVTNQEELDAALAKPPSDDVVIEIHSDPGGYMPIYIFVMDSRGHAVEACGESRVVVSDSARVTARGVVRWKPMMTLGCTPPTLAG